MLNVTLSGGVKRIQWDLEGIYNIQGDIWVKQDGKGFIWSEGRVCERMSCKSGSFLRRQLMIANYHVKKFVRKSQ